MRPPPPPRPPSRRTMAGRSFSGSAPSEPVQNVTPFAGLSTRATNRSKSEPLQMIRGRPKIGHGGSSGWIAIRTPPLPARAAELDVFVDGNALDHGERESGALDLSLEPLEPLAGPRRAHRHVVQGAHHARDARDVPDVRQRDRVVSPEPAKRHAHVRTSCSTSWVDARLQSPGTPSFNAPAAAPNSTASGPGRPRSSAATRPAAKLSPPPTRSTTRTSWCRLSLVEPVVAS